MKLGVRESQEKGALSSWLLLFLTVGWILWDLLRSLVKCVGEPSVSDGISPSAPISMVYGLLHRGLSLPVFCCWCGRAEQLPEASQALVSGKPCTREQMARHFLVAPGKLVSAAVARVGSEAKKT